MQIDAQMLSQPLNLLERIFDSLGDIVYCVKDRDGNYVTVNQAFADRVGANNKQSLIGKSAARFFPADLAKVYQQQDETLFETGRAIVDQLEQITNRDGKVGWYLANKYPLMEADGSVTGLVGVSQDLHTPNNSELAFANLEKVVIAIKENLDQPLKVEPLAKLAGLSAEQLDRRMKRVFRLSTKKFIIKSRLELAAELLRNGASPLAEIADQCGFADQSAFTRQFRSAFLITPSVYRSTQTRL